MTKDVFALLILAALLPCSLHSTDLLSLEDVLNDLIAFELDTFMVHQSLAVYFDRPSIGLHGFSKLFLKRSDRMMKYARKTMSYVNKRKRQVVLKTLQAPKKVSLEQWQEEWTSISAAVDVAYQREKEIYEQIVKLYKFNDVYERRSLNEFLDEFILNQLDSTAKLQSLLSRLNAPSGNNVIDILIDQKLLSDENSLNK